MLKHPVNQDPVEGFFPKRQVKRVANDVTEPLVQVDAYPFSLFMCFSEPATADIQRCQAEKPILGNANFGIYVVALT